MPSRFFDARSPLKLEKIAFVDCFIGSSEQYISNLFVMLKREKREDFGWPGDLQTPFLTTGIMNGFGAGVGR